MKKVLGEDLEMAIAKAQDAEAIVELLRNLQDASGLKVCQNVSKDDVAYKEVK